MAHAELFSVQYLGVDVPNIRTVIHYGPSMDIDDYFQESGRAGRDGKASEAVMFNYPGGENERIL